MVVLDAMEKTARVRVLQTELNDAPGVCIKLAGRIGDIQSAAHAAEATAQAMNTPSSRTSSRSRRRAPAPPGRPRPTSTHSSNSRPSKDRRTP